MKGESDDFRKGRSDSPVVRIYASPQVARFLHICLEVYFCKFFGVLSFCVCVRQCFRFFFYLLYTTHVRFLVYSLVFDHLRRGTHLTQLSAKALHTDLHEPKKKKTVEKKIHKAN